MVAPTKPPAKKPVAKKAAAPKKMTGNVVIDAERLLMDAGISLGQVIGEMFPLERDDTMRMPVRTTLKNVQSKTVAVLMAEWDSDELDDPADRDVEGFADLDDGKAYYDVNVEFARIDVKGFDETRHLVVMFPDSGDLTDFTYEIAVPSTPEGKAFHDALKGRLDKQEIEFLFYGGVNKDQIKAAPKAAAGPKVTGKKVRDPNAPLAKKQVKRADDLLPSTKADKLQKVEDLNKRLAESRERRGVDRDGRLKQKVADLALNGDDTAAAKVKPKAKPRPASALTAAAQDSPSSQAAAFAGQKRPARKKAAPVAADA